MPSKFKSMARHDSTEPLRTMKMSGRPSLLASIFSLAPAVSHASCVIFVSRRVMPPVAAPPPAAAPPEQPAAKSSALARAAQLLDTSVFFICDLPKVTGLRERLSPDFYPARGRSYSGPLGPAPSRVINA